MNSLWRRGKLNFVKNFFLKSYLLLFRWPYRLKSFMKSLLRQRFKTAASLFLAPRERAPSWTLLNHLELENRTSFNPQLFSSPISPLLSVWLVQGSNIRQGIKKLHFCKYSCYGSVPLYLIPPKMNADFPL